MGLSGAMWAALYQGRTEDEMHVGTGENRREISLCTRCVPDAKAWDQAHTPILEAEIDGRIFCPSCAMKVKERFDRENDPNPANY